uniref:Uncharacterized protein n=1 Tax=Arundo donax TaxID=35708 RepID=A0A0A8ZVE6_ARUDO
MPSVTTSCTGQPTKRELNAALANAGKPNSRSKHR